MDISRAARIAAVFGVLIPLQGCLSRVKTSAQEDVAGAALDRRELAEATVAHWSNTSSLAARRMMEQYGVPDEVRADQLIWNGNGPWRRTVVSNVRPGFAENELSELGVVEQSVDYAMSPGQAEKVASFDERVSFNPRSGELLSRADKEEHNFLRMNLADDIVHGRLSPDAAKSSYGSIVNFESSGKTSPYLMGLRFSTNPAPAWP
jgi:hypothetical protein